jgi:hypothetical protein
VLENFPAGKHDDEVDALSGAYENLVSRGAPFESEIFGQRRLFRGIESALGGGRDHWPTRGLHF